MNPETNPKLRALLYTISISGSIHLIVLFLTGIKNQDISYFNPMFAIDFDELYPEAATSTLFFILGWVIFALWVFLIYKYVTSKSN